MAGQPTKYKEEYNELARKVCVLGATDKGLADFLEVSESTINNWKIEYPEFLESIKKGKIIADVIIADSLFQRAKGYEHPEDKIFIYKGEPIIVPTTKHYPPDTGAIAFWLKNRRPNLWREKQTIETVGDTVIYVDIVDDDGEIVY